MVAAAQSSTLPGRNETEPERKLNRPTRLGGSWSERSATCRVGTSPRTTAGMTSRAIRMRDLLVGICGRAGRRIGTIRPAPAYIPYPGLVLAAFIHPRGAPAAGGAGPPMKRHSVFGGAAQHRAVNCWHPEALGTRCRERTAPRARPRGHRDGDDRPWHRDGRGERPANRRRAIQPAGVPALLPAARHLGIRRADRARRAHTAGPRRAARLD